MGSTKNENINAGHRQRVRERYLAEGNFDSFKDYEVLEMLLFYAYPMRDTKPIAKKLIEIYGSLYNVLNADPRQLMQEAGLTQNAAIYLSMLPCVIKRSAASLYSKGKVVNSFLKAEELFAGLLRYQSYESFYMLSLDVNKRVIAVDRINDGNAVEVTFCYENILKKALLNNASFVIIGHNHPSGSCEPSTSDYNITSNLNSGLRQLNIKMLDHLIICDEKTFSFAKSNFFGMDYKN